jgi:hypothetical protein
MIYKEPKKMSVADRKVHHLVHIHDIPRGFLFNTYYTSCGLRWRLKDEKHLSCSHVSMVTCKNCLKTKLSKKVWK